jgi:hypothetical protein
VQLFSSNGRFGIITILYFVEVHFEGVVNDREFFVDEVQYVVAWLILDMTGGDMFFPV